ncbi:MAG: ThuA domain-containing protein, partial [Candidatus Sumerlaeota bacterium]|nr:ThuA domain-containing protein [Candidatus Sumerlaeota bacterium]
MMAIPMRKLFVALCCFAPSYFAFAGEQALIVADEIPAMEVLAKKLKAQEGIESKIVKQPEMPADLAPFMAVIVYIHKDLSAPAEKAFIEYAKGGGKLIVLHHSISSGKRKNKEWFNFLGVSLPQGDVDKGGYKWTEGVTLDIVNLAPDHFITRNKVTYPIQVACKQSDSGGGEKSAPGVKLEDSEVYLNHVLSGSRTVLLGLKYTDAKTSATYMQAHAGWIKPADKGWVIYLMPGHSVREFEDPTYSRI